jgi:tripartite-type tricarboxylate transporter receptor subunit TctC
VKINAIAATVIAVLGAVAHSVAQAQATWPTKPVRLIVAAAPGGGTDVVGRLIAQRLGERFGQPFVVENRGGGGGSVGADAVAKSPADGYTLLMTNDQLTVGASFAANTSYDVLKDFAPVALIGRTPVVLGVNPNVPANTVGELVALVRSQPGKFSFSSCGNGTPLHLAGELLNLSARIDLAHVPYRGCAPALVDVVSGQVPVFFNMIGNAVPYAKTGKLRLLAVASAQRLLNNPSLPTIAESGFPGFEAYPWYGVLAPAGTPREVIGRLGAEITAAVKTPELSERLQSMYFDPTTATPEAFAEILRGDLARWGRVVREAKVKAE